MRVPPRTILAALTCGALLLGTALSDCATAKDQRKLCHDAGAPKAQTCGKLVAKVKTKKPASGDSKGAAAGLLLLQLLF